MANKISSLGVFGSVARLKVLLSNPPLHRAAGLSKVKRSSSPSNKDHYNNPLTITTHKKHPTPLSQYSVLKISDWFIAVL
ncbi:MAG: hypothetical protein K2G77_00565 [Muribaculaceae bacterium]|nr:hypothetical protein [Muribaculaceae bacterium]